MHHFVFPSQDTYITNISGSQNFNFGLNEVLRIGTNLVNNVHISPTTTFTYQTQSVGVWCVSSFTGHIDSGSLTGTSSLLIGSASLITGSTSGSINVSSSFGTYVNFSGSLTNFFGNITSFTGQFTTGIVTGTETILSNHEIFSTEVDTYRSLIQFDITSISASVASGNIVSPKFTLKVKVAREENVPIIYTIYALPISESWVMGNGYTFDGGSSIGASWLFRDFNSGSAWTISGASTSVPTSSQVINYKTGDINMDVTPMVFSWISGSVKNNGILLITSDELQVTSSGINLYYFSNDSNTIYRPVLDVSWNDTLFITGSITTESVSITRYPAGLIGTVSTGSQITGSSVSGSFNGNGNISVTPVFSASGIIAVTGTSGSVSGLFIYGNVVGVMSSSFSASVTSSYLLASLTDGFFSGSTLTASLNGFLLTRGIITGSWNDSQFIGNTISASYPFINYPNIIVATLSGPFINGQVLGSVTTTNPTSSGIFTGIIISGPLAPAAVYLPFSGSVLTSSIAYTSSVSFISKVLDPMDVGKPFVTTIQNLKPSVRAGNIIKINVFGREEFPLKNFARLTQFNQFLTAKYLPSSSYYSIKDNETEEIVLDFDSNTQLSCDLNGNYFLLDTTGFPQERYFKILIKIEQSGSSYTIDNSDIFKIVR